MKRFGLIRILLLTAAFTLIWAAIAGAAGTEEAVGRVVALRGEVSAEKEGGSSRPLSVKDPIYVDDTIVAKKGRVQVMFTDNTLITLGRKTRMKVREYLYDPDDSRSALRTEVKEGSFRVVGGAITRIAPGNFKTQTASGNIGIRGSMYAGLVENHRLTVVFQGGRGIYVENEAGRVEISRPGFGTVVEGVQQLPEEPREFSEDQLSRIENELVPEDLDNGDETAPPDETDAGGDDTQSTDATLQEDESETETVESDSDAALSTEIDQAVADASEDIKTDSLTDVERKILSMLSDLGFAGSRSASVPTAGMYSYLGTMEIQSEFETSTEPVAIAVNWHNQRFIGRSAPGGATTNDGGFAYGEVTSAGELINVHVLGRGGAPMDPEIRTLTGSGTFGHVYGDSHGGIGLAVDGYDVSVRDQTLDYAWSNTIAAVLDAQVSSTESGTATWNGFFFGIAEDMAAPDVDARFFINDDPSDFQMNIDTDAGTFSGSMSGYDEGGSAYILAGLQVGGGADRSVYINSLNLAATLDGTNVIEDTGSGQTADLKTYGNYMTSPDSAPVSAYTQWGYWEAAYREPGTGKDYHIHIPGAMWIAGSQTPQTAVNSLIAANFTASYTGGAQGVLLDGAADQTPLTGGATNLTIDFDTSALNPVSGTISFDQASFTVDGTLPVSSTGFQAPITNASAGGGINGTFYGPNAEGIGGNFSARMSTGEIYQGIFAGDRP